MKFSERSGDDPGAADAAIACLRGGGLLAHPTTGVYGLGGIPGDGRAAEVARLKGRPEGPGIVYLVADREVVRRGFPAAGWSPAAERLAAAFWPGPLTLVLPDGSTYGVAVRAEAHPVTRAVLAALREPLGSSSLNRTGDPPAADRAWRAGRCRACPPPRRTSCSSPRVRCPDRRLPRSCASGGETTRPLPNGRC